METPHPYRIAVLPGDGIGPEVIRETLRAMQATAVGFSLAFTEYPVGGAALDTCGDPLPPKTLAACLASDAVLMGAVGGPRWDALTGPQRPESGLLRLRKALGAFANLRPVSVPAALVAGSPLRPEVVAGADILVVRELTGGIYFGQPRGRVAEGGTVRARNTMVYDADEVARVARVAFTAARRRRGYVTSVDKANVLEVSQLWREVVTQVHATEFPDCTLDHLYVDNAAMQLVRTPRQFDVLLTGNLFGDILSDLAATLPGSLGLLPSASIGGQVGLFEPVHGSAPDLVGQEKANPLAAILSGAMLLDELGTADAAARIRQAVAAVLDEGLRTPDLWHPGHTLVSTAEMGAAVAAHVAALVPAETSAP
jgi:3-isopropylmalate dehydrogenase